MWNEEYQELRRLLMAATRHNLLHLNEGLRIREDIVL